MAPSFKLMEIKISIINIYIKCVEINIIFEGKTFLKTFFFHKLLHKHMGNLTFSRQEMSFLKIIVQYYRDENHDFWFFMIQIKANSENM